MKREIVQSKCQVRDIPLDPDLDLPAWLLEQAQTYGLATLLAHADDGVIWGQVRDDKLLLAGDNFAVSPPLRAVTLQDARLFGPAAEVHLWRDEESGWRSCVVQDGIGNPVETLDEYHMLWGTQIENSEDGFTWVGDGEIKHYHAPPIEGNRLQFGQGGQRRPLRLWVRHYLETDDDTGLVTIGLSRLVDVLADTEVNR